MTRAVLGLLLFAPLVTAAIPQRLSRDEERWLERDVRAIVTDEEAKVFRKLATSEERARFQEIFWARRDPDPSTRENEFREEYEARVAVADSRFQARVGPGSATDMGVVFLLMGFPASVETGRGVVQLEPGRDGGIPASLEGSSTEEAGPGGGVPGGGGPEDAPQRIQTWRYPPDESLGFPDGLEVKFRAQPGYGYRLVRGKDLDRVLEARRRALVARPEVEYALGVDGRLLPMSPDVAGSRASRLLADLLAAGTETSAIPFHVAPAFFRSLAGEVYVPLLFELESGSIGDVTFFGAVSRDGQVVARFEERTYIPAAPGSFEVPLQLAPGDYLVHVGVVDEASGESGSRASSLQVAPFGASEFTTSSVVLHAGAVRSDERGGVAGRAFQFGALDLAPRSRHPFTRAESLGIFFYVYGAAVDPATGIPRVTARYLFHREERESAQTAPRILAASEGQAVASDEIPLDTFEPGEYRLRVLIADEVAGKTLERRSTFRILPE
jgi:GWxTD domain-containing protein